MNIHKMAEHAVPQEQEIFSLSERPFQMAKQNSKIVCFKCFEDQHLVKFFVEGAGLSQHFRTMHRNCDVDVAKCLAIFQEHHAKETANAVQRLNTRRLQSVSEFSFNSYQGNCEYVSSNLKFTIILTI